MTSAAAFIRIRGHATATAKANTAVESDGSIAFAVRYPTAPLPLPCRSCAIKMRGVWSLFQIKSPLNNRRPLQYTIYVDGVWRVEMSPTNVRELRPKLPDSEKITINLGFIDLGQIDLLVEEGFYSNRTDFIRTAIRNQLARHEEALKKTVSRRKLDLGLRHYSRTDLEEVVRQGERLDIVVLGLASIADDVTPELAQRAISSIQVLGALRASAAVKSALDDRQR